MSCPFLKCILGFKNNLKINFQSKEINKNIQVITEGVVLSKYLLLG